MTAPQGAAVELWLTEHWGVIEPDGAGNYRTVELGAFIPALPADAVRLVPEGADPRVIEIRAVMDELARITDDAIAGRGGLSVEALCERRLQLDAELSRLASEAIAAGPERPRWPVPPIKET